jgi:ABC-2 type transport system permease protein
MSYLVDAVRGLCIGHHSFPLVVDVAVIVASAVVFAALATRSFRRMEA